MRHIPFTGTAVLIATLSLIFVRTARAGDPEAIGPRTPATQSGDPLDASAAVPEVHLNLIDHKLALSLAVDTEAQIETAELALKAIVDDALWQFVTVRLEGQRDFAAELEKLTDGRTRAALVRARREIEADKAPDKLRKKGFRLLSIRSATAMLARIQLEILQEYAAMQRAERAAKSAQEFDRHFLRCDVLHQMQALATLKVFESQASADFALVIHQAWIKAKGHFDNARQLLLQLETAPLASVTPARPVLAEAVSETVAVP